MWKACAWQLLLLIIIPSRCWCWGLGRLRFRLDVPTCASFRKREDYCFESTVLKKRTHWASLSFTANSVSSAKNSVGTLWGPKNLAELGVWNRTLWNRIRPVSESLSESSESRVDSAWAGCPGYLVPVLLVLHLNQEHRHHSKRRGWFTYRSSTGL